MLNSVWARKPRDAIAFTFLEASAYLILSGMAYLLLLPDLGLASWPSTDARPSPVTVEDVVKGLGAGNVVAALIQLRQGLGAGTRIEEVLPRLLRNYVVFHLGLAVVASAWAVVRMRAVALKQMFGRPQRRSLAGRLWGRPRIGRWPMVWKEVHAEPGLRLNWFGWMVVLALVLACFVPVVWMISLQLGDVIGGAINAWRELGEAVNAWVRLAGTLVACMLLMTVGVRAASTIAGERDRQTLESLLTSPLEPSAILFAKWLGSIVSVRWGWLWLGLVWLVGLVTTGLHVLALPLLVVGWLVYAGFIAMVGMWFSLVSRTSLRATIWTLMSAVMMGVGHWFVMTMCFYVPVQSLGVDAELGQELRWIPEFEAFGLTPPLTLALFAFQGWEMNDNFFISGKDFLRWGTHALAGLAFWATATLALWVAALRRFREAMGRARRSVPRVSPAAPASQPAVLAPSVAGPGR
jgi:ABC-type transport system involved in multi-copper enzyme maturation permease subunit